MKAFIPLDTTLPVMINGDESNVSIPVSLGAGLEKTFSTTTKLYGGGEMIYAPSFSANQKVYTLSVGGVEKTVAVHPNQTSLLLFSIAALIVIFIAYFTWKRVPVFR